MRRLLKAISGFLALVSLLFLNGGMRATQQEQQKEEMLLFGCRTVGELYKFRSGGEALGGLFFDPKPLSDEKIIEALNACSVYVIDKRSWVDGKWTFTESKEFPTLALAGPLVCDLKDSQGNLLSIQITKAVIEGRATDYSVNPVRREFCVLITVKVAGTGYLDGVNEKAKATAEYNISGSTKVSIVYNSLGKSLK